MADDLVVARPEGLYCPAGDFFIDPMRPVDRAVITHAHADHARGGHRQVLSCAAGEGVLRARLGPRLPVQALAYGERVHHRGVELSLHPAGHVLGSAQVRLAHGGRVWVVSGDYSLSTHDEPNPTCAPFEPVRCDCFVTECTFGLPLYRWRAPSAVFAEIDAWWQDNAAAGRGSVIWAYSLGKAQHLLAGVDRSIGPLLVHPAVETINEAYRAAGVVLPPTRVLDPSAGPDDLAGALVIAPPQPAGSAWADRLRRCRFGFASGWMQLRRERSRLAGARGFVLSDHADWPGLLRAVAATGAGQVRVMHGDTTALVRVLREGGLDAGTLAPSGPGRAIGALAVDD